MSVSNYYVAQDMAGSPQRYTGYQHYPPTSDPGSPVHSTAGHSYAQQVGFFLQQQVPIPTVQSGGPRTTPSGYPGGPVVPPGQVSPRSGRRQGYMQESDNNSVIHNTRTINNINPGPGGPLSFTRALEMTDNIAGHRSQDRVNGGPVRHETDPDHRESVYDMNYEISV